MADLQKTSAYAWLGPQTSGGGKLIFFYSSHHKAEWPIARIYENEWDNLPESLIDQILAAEVDEVSSGAPKKNVAESKGLLNYFPNEITMYVEKDGDKVTKRTSWEETLQVWAGSVPASQAKPAGSKPSLPGGQLANQQVYLGFPDEDKELYQLISEETFFRMADAVTKVEILAEDWSTEAKASLIRSYLYDTARLFNPTRGATLVSPETVDPIHNAKQSILDNEIDVFMDDVANGHAVILDGEHARAVFKKIGVTGFTTEEKDSAESRVALAMKAWLYVDLTSKYEMTPDDALRLVTEPDDEIPW
jgi:hypothetical protein